MSINLVEELTILANGLDALMVDGSASRGIRAALRDRRGELGDLQRALDKNDKEVRELKSALDTLENADMESEAADEYKAVAKARRELERAEAALNKKLGIHADSLAVTQERYHNAVQQTGAIHKIVAETCEIPKNWGSSWHMYAKDWRARGGPPTATEAQGDATAQLIDAIKREPSLRERLAAALAE